MWWSLVSPQCKNTAGHHHHFLDFWTQRSRHFSLFTIVTAAHRSTDLVTSALSNPLLINVFSNLPERWRLHCPKIRLDIVGSFCHLHLMRQQPCTWPAHICRGSTIGFPYLRSYLAVNVKGWDRGSLVVCIIEAWKRHGRTCWELTISEHCFFLCRNMKNTSGTARRSLLYSCPPGLCLIIPTPNLGNSVFMLLPVYL